MQPAFFRRALALAASSLAFLASPVALGAFGLTSATADLTAQTLVVRGTDIVPIPNRSVRVFLGTLELRVIQSTSSQVEAALPGMTPAGSYLVVVTIGPGNSQTDELWVTVGAVGPQGPKGDTGPQGATGAQGLKGDTGAQGLKGDAGAQGLKGDTGSQGLKGDTGAQGLKGDTGAQGLKGDTGAQGLKGDTGLQGPKGDAGPQGVTGATGATGPQGTKGDAGAPGPAGPQGGTGAQGPPGPTGVGTQGPKGDAGAQGPAGPQGPAGLAGASVSIAAISVGDSRCPGGGAALTANGVTVNVCSAPLPPPVTQPESNLLTAADFQQINAWANLPSTQTWKRCYRMTVDGSTSTAFHNLCDNRGRTFFVARSTQGKVFGGHTSLTWAANSCSNYMPDPSAFIFSITNNFRHGLLNSNQAQLPCPTAGPRLGPDLSIAANTSTGTAALGNAYICRTGSANSEACAADLTGARDFTLNELEVYYAQ